MRYINKLLANMVFGMMIFGLSSPLLAQTEHIQGPFFKDRSMSITGEVIAIGAPYRGNNCAMLRVIPNENHSGGRAWVCKTPVNFNLSIGQHINIVGVSKDTRLTRMGPMMRVAPIYVNPKIKNL